jgi:hypothetical protein
MALCLFRTRQSLSLAATSTATATTFTFFTTAIVAEHVQLVHGFHLLSYRSLSIKLAKKTGCSLAKDASRSGLDGFEQIFGCNRFGRELDHELTTTI